MSRPGEERAGLARRQRQLVSALVSGGDSPAGLDCEDLAAAARSIALKRLGEVRRSWPSLCRKLEPGLEARFVAYALEHPPPAAGAVADALAFARCLRRQGALPKLAQTELVAFHARWRMRDGRPMPRRRPALRIAALSRPVRLAALLRVARIGDRRPQLRLRRLSSHASTPRRSRPGGEPASTGVDRGDG